MSAEGLTPASPDVLKRTALNRAAISFQARALIRLIEDVLKGETRAIEVAPSLFPDLRLPGDNSDDALRYLLRGLRNDLGTLQASLKAMDADPAAVGAQLGPLRQLALAVAQAFAAAPETGAGEAILSMIGSLLDGAGLMPLADFLRRYGGARTQGLGAVDLSALAAVPAAEAPATALDEAARRPVAARPPMAEADTAPAARAGDPAEAGEAAEAEDPLEIPLILVRPLQGDWARVLFKRGLAYLTRVYNEPPEKLRPVLGAWLAQSGHDHKKVFRLLARAQTQKVSDPKGWVSKILTEGESAHSPA